jgi:hypothetical protein
MNKMKFVNISTIKFAPISKKIRSNTTPIRLTHIQHSSIQHYVLTWQHWFRWEYIAISDVSHDSNKAETEIYGFIILCTAEF